MQAGALRHRVTIQAATETQNDFGEVTKTWSDLATVWAAVEALSGREYFEARQLQRSTLTRMIIRWRDDVTAGHRVRWTDTMGTTHTYDIESVIADRTHRAQLTLMCVEVT